MTTAHHALGLILTLQDDTLFAESSATEGGLHTLPYVPGASLWGAVAARLYADFKPKGLHHDAFHQDRLRFLDGLPLAPSGYPALPAPAVWQRKKTTDAAANAQANDLLNLAARGPEAGVQRKSLRSHNISADGCIVKTATATVLKTALEPGRERARDSQLFVYESLRSGERFYAEVHADEDLDPAIWAAVSAMLQDTTLRLGRSRSAQFGRVRCTAITLAPLHWGWPLAEACAPPSAASQRLVFWCVSDLALLDAFGQPTATPSASEFRLDPAEWTYNPAASAVDVRRYSPYNSYRCSHDTERMVIRRGSVLCFDAAASHLPLNAAALTALRQSLAPGVGLYRANGLGQVLAQPEWSQHEFVAFCPSELPYQLRIQEQEEQPVATDADLKFLDWLKARSGQGATAADTASQIAQSIAHELQGVIRLAARLAGNTTTVTPLRSQWGLLLEVGKGAHTLEKLLHALGSGPLQGAHVLTSTSMPWQEDSAARGKKNKVWFAASFAADGKATTLGDHLLKLLQTKLNAIPVRPGAVLAKLANAMREDISQNAHKDAA
jgi:CRISPR-associated protein Csx10